MTTVINELVQRIKAAADREMISRDLGETSSIWRDSVTPENILALVEALEKAQRANAAQDDHINQQQDRIDQLEKGHQEAVKQINSWRRMAKQNIAEREKDIAELDAARQRIAELESSTVTVKLYDDFQLCHYGTTEEYAKGYIDSQNNFIKWLKAAGIKWEAE